ncbi:MAG: hypothetical protein ACRELX_09590 [Longimicrobiales bacterium]
MQLRSMKTVIVLTALLASGPLAAQTVTLDEGTFRLLVDGNEVGTETFSIRQNGTGADAVIIARGRVVLDTARSGEELTSSLQLAGGTLRPAAYDVTVEGADTRKIAGRVMGGRFSARIVSSAGENLREYLVSDGAIVVDEGIAHHYYFLARRLDGGPLRVPIVIPRASKQVSAAVSVAGREAVQVGGQSVNARHITVEPAGEPIRHVWVDDEDRVLRVEIPARRLVAERTSVPG